MSELELAQAVLTELLNTPAPDDFRDRVRWRMKAQGAMKRVERARKVIELEQTK